MAADDETNQPATIDQAFFKQAKSKRYLAYTILGSLPPLSERQERQRVMSVSSLHDHLSWGFGSNITRGYNSITTSVSKNMEIKTLVEIYYRQVALYLSARREKKPSIERSEAKDVSSSHCSRPRPENSDVDAIACDSWSRQKSRKHVFKNANAAFH